VRWGARHDEGLDKALARLATTAGLDRVQRHD